MRNLVCIPAQTPPFERASDCDLAEAEGCFRKRTHHCHDSEDETGFFVRSKPAIKDEAAGRYLRLYKGRITT